VSVCERAILRLSPCWPASAQRKCCPTGRCTSRHPVTCLLSTNSPPPERRGVCPMRATSPLLLLMKLAFIFSFSSRDSNLMTFPAATAMAPVPPLPPPPPTLFPPSHESNLMTFPAATLLPLSLRVNLPSCLYSLKTCRQTGLWHVICAPGMRGEAVHAHRPIHRLPQSFFLSLSLSLPLTWTTALHWRGNSLGLGFRV
jgi:hypothetical protein